jgi:hypothetical protein
VGLQETGAHSDVEVRGDVGAHRSRTGAFSSGSSRSRR